MQTDRHTDRHTHTLMQRTMQPDRHTHTPLQRTVQTDTYAHRHRHTLMQRTMQPDSQTDKHTCAQVRVRLQFGQYLAGKRKKLHNISILFYIYFTWIQRINKQTYKRTFYNRV